MNARTTVQGSITSDPYSIKRQSSGSEFDGQQRNVIISSSAHAANMAARSDLTHGEHTMMRDARTSAMLRVPVHITGRACNRNLGANEKQGDLKKPAAEA